MAWFPRSHELGSLSLPLLSPESEGYARLPGSHDEAISSDTVTTQTSQMKPAPYFHSCVERRLTKEKAKSDYTRSQKDTLKKIIDERLLSALPYLCEGDAAKWVIETVKSTDDQTECLQRVKEFMQPIAEHCNTNVTQTKLLAASFIAHTVHMPLLLVFPPALIPQTALLALFTHAVAKVVASTRAIDEHIIQQVFSQQNPDHIQASLLGGALPGQSR